jgi:hypothetical protein
MTSDSAPDTLSLMRRIVLGILAFESLGLLAELGLLGHFKSPTQVIPVALLGLTLVSSLAAYRAQSVTTLRVFQVVMVLVILGGAFGVWEHLEGNLAFSLELHPQMGFLERAWDVLKGATPTLASGTLVQMGLLGLVYTFRHPVFSSQTP